MYVCVIYIYIYKYIYIPSVLSLPPTPSQLYPSRSSQSIELSPPCYIAASQGLSILHKVMYVFQRYSLNSSHPLLPPLCPQVRSLCLWLYVCPANRFISTIFLDSISMCYHTVFIFLLVTYFTLYKSLSPARSLQMTQFHSILWLSNRE